MLRYDFVVWSKLQQTSKDNPLPKESRKKLSVDVQLQQDLRVLEAQQCFICQEKLITDMVPS